MDCGLVTKNSDYGQSLKTLGLLFVDKVKTRLDVPFYATGNPQTLISFLVYLSELFLKKKHSVVHVLYLYSEF